MVSGGVVNLLIGYEIATTPYWCSKHWPFCWDWSAYNVPLGIGVGIGGLIMFTFAFRKNKNGVRGIFICPQCETALPYAEVPDETCPKCQIKMEPLDGFYDRHPELKNNE